MTAEISITVHLGQTYAAAGMDVTRFVFLDRQSSHAVTRQLVLTVWKMI